MPNTWIIVADGARARLFALAAKDAQLTEIGCFVNPQQGMPDGDFAAKRGLPADEGATLLRHAPQPHMPARARSAERFARLLGEVLERGREQGRYGNLVLVAPPRFLGVLRSGLGERVREHVRAEIHRDLTTLPGAEVRTRLPDRLFRVRQRIPA